MESVVANPRFVPKNVIAKVSYLLHDLAHVVDRAVIGSELDTGDPEWARALGAFGIFDERVLANLIAEIILVPSVPVDGADHAERIARRRQKDRDSARLDQG